MRDEVRQLRLCAFVDAARPLPNGMAVVVDTVENIADFITVHEGKVMYRGVEAVSIANPNLMPELGRRGTVQRDGVRYCMDTSAFHDGSFVELVHDKDDQQRVVARMGIVPLDCWECHNVEACVLAIKAIQAAGKASVAKMNGGSGGSGMLAPSGARRRGPATRSPAAR